MSKKVQIGLSGPCYAQNCQQVTVATKELQKRRNGRRRVSWRDEIVAVPDARWSTQTSKWKRLMMMMLLVKVFVILNEVGKGMRRRNIIGVWYSGQPAQHYHY